MIKGNVPKLDLPAYVEPGHLFVFLPIYLLGNVLFSILILYKHLKQNHGYKRSQIAIFLVATIIGFGTGTTTYLLIYDIPIKPITTPLVVLYPILIAYAIIKYKFLNIQKLIKNTLIFAVLFFFLLGVVSVALFLIHQVMSRWIGIHPALAQAVAIAIAISLYGPLKSILSKMTDKILHQQTESEEEVFSQLTRDILHCTTTASFAAKVAQKACDTFRLHHAVLYVRDPGSPFIYSPFSAGNTQHDTSLLHSQPLVRELERTQKPLVRGGSVSGLDNGKKAKGPQAVALNDRQISGAALSELESINAVAAFPVFTQNSLSAILLVSSKKSDRVWQANEFRILSGFCRYLSLALVNIRYAESIQRSRQRIAKSERDVSAGALIAGIDHEVKNPLHTMALALSTLRDRLKNPAFVADRAKVKDKSLRTLDGVLDDIKRVNSIIDHLSALANRRPLHIKEDISPAEVARRIIAEQRKLDPRPDIEFICDIPEHLTFTSDQDVLYEILSNLVRNASQAIKEAGRITLKAATKNDLFLIEVKDTGPGIPKSRMKKIFEPFFTTKGSDYEKGYGFGSGMGLFIVKEYMQSLGGRIDVQSEPDKGTTFRLYFPSMETAAREAA